MFTCCKGLCPDLKDLFKHNTRSVCRDLFPDPGGNKSRDPVCKLLWRSQKGNKLKPGSFHSGHWETQQMVINDVQVLLDDEPGHNPCTLKAA